MNAVLDVCCGSRMFWFDKADSRVICIDKRAENYLSNDSSSPDGKRKITISPDAQADFTSLPFSSCSFNLVVFDPPHLLNIGDSSWMAKKYGKLTDGWEQMIQDGFSECFRVLAMGGTLIFKWSSMQIPLSRILALTTAKPLFGHTSGRHNTTHWVSFTKGEN